MAIVETKTATVALIGNPNTGKSTLFSALAGVRQRIGNYPGVTVEKKIGHCEAAGRKLALVDLPGTYSLAPRSLDEMVAVDVLLGRRDDVPTCDAVVCIVDASNLERNLYLVSQVLELRLPTIVALNMTDVARDRGITIDVAKLEERLGVRVVAVQANKRRGLDALKTAIADAIGQPPVDRASPFPEAFQHEVSALAERLEDFRSVGDSEPGGDAPRYLVERLLLDTSGYLEQGARLTRDVSQQRELHEYLQAARARLSAAGLPVPAVEAMSRYQWVGSVLEGAIERASDGQQESFSDKVDRFLTHRFWGTLAFAIVMLAMFSSIFIAADPLMGAIDGVMGSIGEQIEGRMDDGALRSLLVDGIVAGVGGVIVFLPQILILFLFIAILEDCGYMARAAYLMDKLMVRVGLSGKSFIPLLSSFACAIPGIMSARVIENRRDRLTTILVAPLMSCSARLPVYILLIGAFIPAQYLLGGWLSLQGLVMFAMYSVGVVAAAGVALVLKRTMLRGPTPAFVMELPPYKIPSARLVVERMTERGWSFVKRAGTLIVAVTIVVWALSYFPHDEAGAQVALERHREQLAARVDNLPPENEARAALASEVQALQSNKEEQQKFIDGVLLRDSYLGRFGHAIEPVVRPLGWDWRVGSAAIASFPAREVVIGTMGVIYNMGEVDVDDDESRTQLQSQLRAATWDGTDRPVFTVPMAIGLMVFFALCAQCGATLIVIRRETGNWFWPAFTFVYMTALAYVGALATYQIGTRLF